LRDWHGNGNGNVNVGLFGLGGRGVSRF